MAMKQTQTKLFDFSDVGLDFCAGSKTLFPDRFKRMLALGYNEQTVVSVVVAGNQVTFTYGGAHRYVADRVLKIDSGSLSLINKGEFWIDSVTTNTVTMSIDDVPSSIIGGFTTRIAPLGWELVYELANIHIYKFKALDESDLYLRLCFQDAAALRNCISPCVGRSADLASGAITDVNALVENKSILSPGNGFKWDLQERATATYNNYTYSQGVSSFGVACVVGSQYHFVLMANTGSAAGYGVLSAILPAITFNAAALDYPLMLGNRYGNINGNNNGNMLSSAEAYVGSVSVTFQPSNGNSSTPYNFIDARPQASNSFLPANIEPFNTTTAEPIPLYVKGNGQIVGYTTGMYKAKYASSSTPAMTSSESPSSTTDIDLSVNIKLHYMSDASIGAYATFYAVPIEEIKIA